MTGPSPEPTLVYTLRDLGGGSYHLVKWDAMRREPLDVYLMSGAAGCTCPSPKFPCKHVPIKKALLESVATDPRGFLWQKAWQDGVVFDTLDLGELPFSGDTSKSG